MPVQWTGSVPGLLVHVDRSLLEPLSSQLQRALRDAIRAGRLSVGERLPSSRILARELGVSRGLVLECYKQFEAEGYLTARVGSATSVAARACVPAAPAREQVTVPQVAIDFRCGIPDLASFPMRDWLRCLTQAARASRLPRNGGMPS